MIPGKVSCGRLRTCQVRVEGDDILIVLNG